ncbi:hypothetical protein ACQR16_17250 [Bradyrhizobium oligotrophicum]|uniref:hypothetical protein n=1 Tax=Bradyrhizobium oligotrophicum TaxID=44255 RepID=UPI003EBE93D7
MADVVSDSGPVANQPRAATIGVPIALLGLAAVMAFKLLSIRSGTFDAMSTDDVMRLVEVRDFLDGQAWWDLRQYRLGPSGVLMHWSRIVDLPLAMSILALKPLVGSHEAEAVTLFVWPLLLFGVALILVGKIASRLSGGASSSVLGAAVLAMLAAPALIHFKPGAIDHHNVQIDLLLLMLLSGVQAERSATMAALAGVTAAVSLAIGVEILPVIATICAALVGLFIWRGGPVARQISAFGIALAGSSAALGLMLVRPEALTLPVFDALGGPLLLLTVGGGIGLVLMVEIDRSRSALWLRAVTATATAIVLIGAFVLLFAKSLVSPYSQLDPLVVSLWLDHVQETVSLVTMARLGPEEVLGFYAFPFITLAIVTAAFLRSDPADRFRWGLCGAALAALIAISVWEMRGTGGAAMAAAPIFAAAAVFVWPSLARGNNLVLLAFAVSPVMLSILGQGAKPLIETMVQPTDIVFDSDASRCQTVSDAEPMRRLPRGNVVAPIDLGPAILADTTHVVFAGPYHRNNDGNLAMLKLMLASAAAAQQILRDYHVDYVVVCRTSPNRDIIKLAPDGLESLLVQGETPEFLEPLEFASSPKIAVWRVRQ